MHGSSRPFSTVTSPGIDYDAIAAGYDRRYLINDYSGVERAVSEFAGHASGERVLEVGCGTGHWLRLLGTRGVAPTGLDASIRMLAHARSHAHSPLVHGFAERLPFATASFDRVFCVNALHHFRDKRTFFAEARRVLRRGQVMTIGLDPHAGVDRWYIYEYFDSVLDMDRRRYASARQIHEWMEAAGFVDCVTRVVQHLPVRLSARAAIEQGRLDRAATSQLGLLTAKQYEDGIHRIWKDIESAEAEGRTLDLTADLRLYATTGSAR
jgi:ubiquinone/menaquinone biosynthesis C-methylase UbiE